MFSANCDQCGARNEFPANAQNEGINAGSLIHCPNCGAEVRVELVAEDSGERPAVATESLGEPVGEAIVPNDDLGDDEKTQVLEASSLPDAGAKRQNGSPDDSEPMTLRRGKSGGVDAARHTPSAEAEAAAMAELSIEATEGLEPTPESLVPLSERDFIPSERGARHQPLPPARPRRTSASSTATEETAAAPQGLVRKAAPHPPRREHHDQASESNLVNGRAGAHEALMPPAGPLDEIWDAKVPTLRPPSPTDAPVASVSRPPEPPKVPPRNGGTLGFILLVAGVAFVAGLAVKNAKQGESAAPVIPAAAPLAEAKPVDPIPQPVAQVATPPAPAPASELPSETPAAASPPPALAKPESEPRRPQSMVPTVHAAKVSSAEQAPKAMPASDRDSTDAPRSTVAPVRSANAAVEAPPVEAAFDAEATSTALNSAAQRASSCRKQNDPSGVAVVTITFAPSGRVTSANISGPPFAGTETGSCIASVLRGVKVPAYAGDFMTVRKTIQVE